MRLHRKWQVWLALAAIGALLGYAWVDGGRRPLAELSQPVAVPESQR